MHDEQSWRLTSHADVIHAASRPDLFSSQVSRHLQIPNGLDGADHALWRPFVEKWFSASRMALVHPVLVEAADDLVRGLVPGAPFDAAGDLGARYAVRATCLWLGWPLAEEDWLLAWMRRNVEATRSGDHGRTAVVAAEFDGFIQRMVDLPGDGSGSPTVTAELAGDTVDGRGLRHDEVVSVLRNWTAGDMSSVALCIGVVLRLLADRPEVQAEVRKRIDDDEAFDRAVDEVLRIDDPFVANRRRTTCPVDVGGTGVPAGARVLLDWTAANRDPLRFPAPGVAGGVDGFAPELHAEHNVVYGWGPHVCPGRPLATLELRVLVRAVLSSCSVLEAAGPGVRSEPPLGGWASAPVVLRR